MPAYLALIGPRYSASTRAGVVLELARSHMDITETKSGGTLVMAPNGRLDAAAAQGFHERLLSCIAGGETSVLLDLVHLEYISSAGLRSLLAAAKRLQACDGRFAVCALTDNVREVFQVSGFDTVIEVHPDRATALQRLA
jgi:anti-sigma B factor antagonist